MRIAQKLFHDFLAPKITNFAGGYPCCCQGSSSSFSSSSHSISESQSLSLSSSLSSPSLSSPSIASHSCLEWCVDGKSSDQVLLSLHGFLLCYGCPVGTGASLDGDWLLTQFGDCAWNYFDPDCVSMTVFISATNKIQLVITKYFAGSAVIGQGNVTGTYTNPGGQIDCCDGSYSGASAVGSAGGFGSMCIFNTLTWDVSFLGCL